jgi:uncharacterized Zn-finger protein
MFNSAVSNGFFRRLFSHPFHSLPVQEPIVLWRPGLLMYKGYTAVGGMPRYFCGVCGYSSTNSYNVKTHTFRHTGEKPYVCEFCCTGFRQASTLKGHKLSCILRRSVHCSF